MSDAKPIIPDVLASRYASAALCRIWSPQGRVLSERELWIAVMKAQRELGVDVPEQAIAAYERVKTQVDLASIDQRERVSRHDVKARIEEFCALAGHETIHMGMTSRDLTDNVEQLQVRRSLLLLRDKTIAALVQLAAAAEQYKETLLVGRTHHVPAQPTTLGKRLAMFGEELLRGWERLQSTLETYPLRGLKGAVGTQLDLISLLNGAGSVQQLEAAIAAELGFARVLNAVGQVYPRSLDYEVLSALYQVGAGLADFATSMRLMTGHELVSEGFGKHQVGSSAMPHKMNTRSSERINGFHALLGGYLEMTARLAGGQWNEGDVSDSVVRRVALPSGMFALDGMLETFLTVLAEMEVHESAISAELRRTLPFLATTSLLMAALKTGAGREAMHGVIRGHAVAVARGLREGVQVDNDLLARLGDDAAFPLSREEVEQVLADPRQFLGAAPAQVEAFTARVAELSAQYPEAAAYRPEPIL
ncbi:MAG: adenylosuccinate lyase [SAR324 cluster bacterium]|nr:adenylosuccinate lyase [SAR324 cluster bacterium]